ncbi:MAG: hypothetical protein ACI9WS_002995, partial [Paraglaciecola psychrophila]
GADVAVSAVTQVATQIVTQIVTQVIAPVADQTAVANYTAVFIR